MSKREEVISALYSTEQGYKHEFKKHDKIKTDRLSIALTIKMSYLMGQSILKKIQLLP